MAKDRRKSCIKLIKVCSLEAYQSVDPKQLYKLHHLIIILSSSRSTQHLCSSNTLLVVLLYAGCQ